MMRLFDTHVIVEVEREDHALTVQLDLAEALDEAICEAIGNVRKRYSHVEMKVTFA